MGGYYNHSYLSSVDIIDTSKHTVIAGPSMTVPRQWCASAVIGHRIFVVGGHGEHGFLDSVEYLDYATPCDNHETKKGNWFDIHFLLDHLDHSFGVEAFQCTKVVCNGCRGILSGGGRRTLSKRGSLGHAKQPWVWNLPPLDNHRTGCSMVTVANEVAMISGWGSPTCATLPLLDKHTWCFR